MRTRLAIMMMFLGACAAPDDAPHDPAEPPPDDEGRVDGLDVEIVDDPDAVWDCDALGGPIKCSADYLDLAAVLAPPEIDLDRCVAEAASTYREIQEEITPLEIEEDYYPSSESLASRLIDELAMREWIDGIDERPLLLTRRLLRRTELYEEEEFLVTDPLVGTFELRMFRPYTEGPLPVVVGMPGHPLVRHRRDPPGPLPDPLAHQRLQQPPARRPLPGAGVQLPGRPPRGPRLPGRRAPGRQRRGVALLTGTRGSRRPSRRPTAPGRRWRRRRSPGRRDRGRRGCAWGSLRPSPPWLRRLPLWVGRAPPAARIAFGTVRERNHRARADTPRGAGRRPVSAR